MRRFSGHIIIGFILVLLCYCKEYEKELPDFYNLDFERVIPGSDIPYAWQYNNIGGYTIGISKESKRDNNSLRIYCEKPEKNWFPEDSLVSGRFLNALPFRQLQGKELTLKGKIKTKAVAKMAGLFILVKDSADKIFINKEHSIDNGVRGTKIWQKVSLTVPIDNNTSHVVFGGVMYGRGTAWFDDLEIYIDGKKYTDPLPDFHEPTPEEIAWLRQYAYPLDTCEPKTDSDTDLEVIKGLIGNASSVALGNSMGNSSEVYKLKHRLIKYLVEQKGFNSLFLGANSAIASYLNYCIKDKSCDYTGVLRGDPSQRFANQEFSDIVKYIRSNHEKGGDMRLSSLYPGFDPKNFDIFRQHFSSNQEVMQSINNLEEQCRLIQKNNMWGKLSDDEINAFLPLSTPLVIAILKMEDPQDKASLRQLFSDFDRNISYQQGNSEQKKTILWTINSHSRSPEKCLIDSLYKDYIPVGFTYNKGSSMADGRHGRLSYKVQEAYPGTYEYYFSKLEEPYLLIDLRSAKKDLSPHGEWLRKPQYFRIDNDMKITTEFSRMILTENFDFLLYINESSPIKTYNWN